MAQEKSKDDVADLAPEELPHGHAHKNTTRWCEGKEGRQHEPRISIPANLPNWWKDPCGWYEIAANHRRLVYTCHHVEECAACGKVLRRHYSWLPQARLLPKEMAAEECPDYTPASIAQRTRTP